MKSNIIITICSNNNVRLKFIEKANQYISFSYVKIETILLSIAETLGRKLTEEECINFVNKYIDKIEKEKSFCIVDIDNYNEKIIKSFIGNKQVHIIDLNKYNIVNNSVYIDGKEENLEAKFKELKKYIEGEKKDV